MPPSQASPPAILVAARDIDSARDLADSLNEAGERAEAVSGEARLTRLLETRAFDVLLADEIGIEQLSAGRAGDLGPALILLTGFGTVEDEVQALRRGAFEVVRKPADPEQVLLAVRRARASRSLAEENRRLRAAVEGRVRLGALATRDGRLQRVLASAESVASTRATVLIEGESGTGKTLLARAIHAASSRARGPFVEVSCGALPSTLLESELFGHARGAFTGAARDRSGKVEAADGGTLFLDEIGCAPPELQQKLLRVLQDRAFERLGETRTRSSDARVIAATNEDLSRAVAEGSFREDLYWRIRVVRLELPPLRERACDVPFLAQSFLQRYAAEHGRDLPRLSEGAQAALVAWPWPGNVRELEHAIERAVLLARGNEIAASDLGLEAPRGGSRGRAAPGHGAPGQAAPGQAGPGQGGPAEDPARELSDCLRALLSGGRALTLREALEVPEREIVRLALELCGGSRKAAARMLDVNRGTLFNKMRKYGLMEPRPGAGAPEADGPSS